VDAQPSANVIVAIAAVAQGIARVRGLNGFTRMRSDRASPHRVLIVGLRRQQEVPHDANRAGAEPLTVPGRCRLKNSVREVERKL
jgi:hypothetical protein